MAKNENHKALVSCSIMCILVAILHMLSNGCAEGRHFLVQNPKYIKYEHKGTIKTIECDDGEIIDCVDIYKQPAFDNPLIKDLQMEPSSYPARVMKVINDGDRGVPTQNWNKNGEYCPEGTIPIRRSAAIEKEFSKISPYPNQKNRQDFNQSFQQLAAPNDNPKHEYATVRYRGAVYGAQAVFNLWNPNVERGDMSISQIWLVSNFTNSDEKNTIEAGWFVFPGRFDDDHATRLFIYWTRDNYRTGCYNLECAGFVQTHGRFVLGAPIEPVSVYNGIQKEYAISVHKDREDGNWWLMLQGEVVGYWPRSIFTRFRDEGAEYVDWGGEIFDRRNRRHHTATHMGSGHFASEGYRKASYVRNLGVIDRFGTEHDPDHFGVIASNPQCYTTAIPNRNADFGVHFYFGGPGYTGNSPCR